MCPSRVRKRWGEFRLQDSHRPRLGQLQPMGTREGKSERQKHGDQTGQDKGPEKSQQWRKWERGRDQHRRWGEGTGEGQCRRAPMGRAEKERRDKEQEKENKGAVGVNSPSPQPP